MAKSTPLRTSTRWLKTLADRPDAPIIRSQNIHMTKTGRIAILSIITAAWLAAITAVHIYYVRDVQRENREGSSALDCYPC